MTNAKKQKKCLNVKGIVHFKMNFFICFSLL